MATRRDFIKALAVAAPALTATRGWAAGPLSAASPDPSRLALVIGNSAYREAPLINPANDARAISTLCADAGFTVDSRLDATRVDMMAAIERFGAAVKRPQTRQVLFYYAGHGAQLDWRNYLLPVDAVVENQEQIKQRCVDLGFLLGQLSAARDKTFIVILDACRNNPFGTIYRPQQKGLSQFDAPVGSLLAYATSPGHVASDGDGSNGLYTENLVRELAQRGARVEDALKRVRLNVRLASRGQQIPWETTSLESDVFLFSEGHKPLSEDQLEALAEADVAEWTRIKSSRRVDDWVAYLRRFPNGRFAEIAQVRLTRLLTEGELPVAPAAPPTSPAPVAALPADAALAVIDLRAGVAVPTLIAPSANPFSAGRFPLGRVYTVGDEAIIRQTDILTGVEENVRKLRVTRVDYDQDRVEFNDGRLITDLMGNFVKSGEAEFDTPVQWTPAELQIGKKWTAAFIRTHNGEASNVSFNMHVVKREKITVPAGVFDTFRIEGEGWNKTRGHRREVRLWLVPGLIFPVRSESLAHSRKGQLREAQRRELVSLRQQASAPVAGS